MSSHICIIYQILSKLPKSKKAVIYHLIEASTWLIMTYLFCNQSLNWHFTNLNVFLRSVRTRILCIRNLLLNPPPPPPNNHISIIGIFGQTLAASPPQHAFILFECSLTWFGFNWPQMTCLYLVYPLLTILPNTDIQMLRSCAMFSPSSPLPHQSLSWTTCWGWQTGMEIESLIWKTSG